MSRSGLSESELKERAQAELSAGAGDRPPKPGEVYQHYKGGIYSIVAVSVKEDTLEPLVTYHSNKLNVNWTRTLINFTEKVECEGSMVPRFRHLDI